MRMRSIREGNSVTVVTSLLAFLLIAVSGSAQSTLSPELQQKVDTAVQEELTKTGVPSASVAIVQNGEIAYLHAFGAARLDPKTPALPEMRYSIGSISKQFTAAAILLLQEQGKLSLDDKVSKFIPGLTRANEVSIRQLLSHTSGYQDYWPQDYIPPLMLTDISAERILDLWARKPLDFDPGTKWQYSNTNYVIAGLIIEKVSGEPLLKFLQERVFAPLSMKSVANIDQEKLGDTDSVGYLRYALGPLRVAPKEGKGWLFAMAELAMPAGDLARWDIAMIDRKLLKPSSYDEMETEVLLKNGLGTQYGLGVGVSRQVDRRAIAHGGEVSGFTAENIVFPDDRAAVVVLTNQDAAPASGNLATRIATLLFSPQGSAAAAKTAQARGIFEGLQKNTIDRTLFTDNANGYFSEQTMKDFAASLGPLGPPQEFVQTREALRGGMTLRVYRAKFAKQTLRVWTYEMPDGKLEQYQVSTE
jgi:D-alanyl-D-alanine carboxypeptidase